MRVGDFAKQSGMSYAEVKAKLEGLGIDKTHPLNELTEAELARLKDAVNPPKQAIISFPANSRPTAKFIGGPWTSRELRQAALAMKRQIPIWRKESTQRSQ